MVRVVGLPGLAPLRAPQYARREDEREHPSHAQRVQRPDEQEGWAGPGDRAAKNASRSHHVGDRHEKRKQRPDQHDDVPRSPFGEHQRSVQPDGLGRLTSVSEDPNGLNYQSVYKYDAFNNLTCVEQHGGQSSTGCAADPSNDATSTWRVRRFTYDPLSRLTSAKNPENNTTSYAYDAASNLISKTDPRPITITYTPDALNRITQKSYSNGEFTIHYCYDNQQTACGTSAASNGIGRRTGMLDVSGSTAWSYDVMGRPLAITKSVGGVSTPTNYTYYLDGSRVPHSFVIFE